MTDIKESFARVFRGYDFVLLLGATFFAAYALLIPGSLSEPTPVVRAIVATFLFGSLVGLAEIASRYRDEPLRAVRSPYGLAYIVINGFLSLLAFMLILRFPGSFPASVSGNLFAAAFAAGFGAMVVMRSRIAIIKTPDGRDESIGPDYVLKIVLKTIDSKIDRWRAESRQRILATNIEKIKELGDLQSAYQYLGASLLAFQNLDDSQKSTLNETYNDYKNQANVPEDIKQLALGFIFLTLVGESHFSTVLNNAKELMAKRRPLDPSIIASSSPGVQSSSSAGATSGTP